MSRSLHGTSTESPEIVTTTETSPTGVQTHNHVVESAKSVVATTNNKANNNKKHASMSSSQIPVLSKVCFYPFPHNIFVLLHVIVCMNV